MAGMTVLQSCAAVHLHRLTIRDFRNIAQAEVEAPRAGFVLVGDNGQGKTNLLEAIQYLETFRSFRRAPEEQMVRIGAGYFRIEGRIEGPEAGGGRLRGHHPGVRLHDDREHHREAGRARHERAEPGRVAPDEVAPVGRPQRGLVAGAPGAEQLLGLGLEK